VLSKEIIWLCQIFKKRFEFFMIIFCNNFVNNYMKKLPLTCWVWSKLYSYAEFLKNTICIMNYYKFLNYIKKLNYPYIFFFGINHAVSWTLVQTNPRSHRVGPQRGKVLPKRGSPYTRRGRNPDIAYGIYNIS
jgi:hypothetical protein